MKPLLPVPIAALVLLSAAIPLAAMAGTAGSNQPQTTAVKPFDSIQESTITRISDSSITVTHEKAKPGTTKPGTNKKGAAKPVAKNTKSTAGKTDASKEKVTKTYQINGFTDIEFNGQKATVSALHPGMAVSISADPPTSLSANDDSDGGTAKVILAHDAPDPQTSPAPVPAKHKK